MLLATAYPLFGPRGEKRDAEMGVGYADVPELGCWAVSRSASLCVVLVLNVALVVSLVVVGLSAHSLSVLAEGVDYVADSAAIGVSLLAIWLSNRPPTEARPSGFPRATTIAALVNAGWLVVLCILVIVGAVDRLVGVSGRVRGLPVLVISGIAAVVMLGGALILRENIEADDDDLNARAVLLDTVADAAAAAGVAVTGGVIFLAGGLYWLDPTVALIIAVVVVVHAMGLLAKISQALHSPGTTHTLPPGWTSETEP